MTAGADIKPARLRKRSDFLAANSGRRLQTPAFTLLARPRNDGTSGVRTGFTCSRKLGNAVARNRAKRRLRELARLSSELTRLQGWDLVLIGRPNITASRNFLQMQADLAQALQKLPPA